MKSRTPWHILFAAPLILVACASGPAPRSLPPLDVQALARQATPLSVALVAAEQIPDVHSRIFAYTEIARGYLAQDDSEQAVRLLDRALQLTDIAGLTQDAPDIQSSVAGVLVQTGETARAVKLLQTALAGARSIKDDTTRGLVLEKIISACFDAGPPAYDVLRQTIQAVYVIEDLWVRASLLVDTARRYQDAGLTQPVNVLLQQAIPAAGSIASPWLKSLALSDIAVRFQVSGNQDSAGYYASRAVDQITSVTVVRRSEEDASRVLQVAQNLATLRLVPEALKVIQTVEYTYLRAEGYASVAKRLSGTPEETRALDLCSQAVDLAQSVQNPYQRAEALAAVADAYGTVHQLRLALATAGVAQDLLPRISNSAQRAAAVDSISKVVIRWGDWQTALSLASAVPDPYYRASTMVSVSDMLVSEKKSTAAENALALAESDAARAPYLRDNLYRSAALARIDLGDYSAAIGDIGRIQSAYPISTTLAELGRRLASSGQQGGPAAGAAELSVNAGDTLRNIAQSLLKPGAGTGVVPAPATQQVPPPSQTPPGPSGSSQGGGQGL
ncbi:hypothetical protein [Salinispira pacifica]